MVDEQANDAEIFFSVERQVAHELGDTISHWFRVLSAILRAIRFDSEFSRFFFVFFLCVFLCRLSSSCFIYGTYSAVLITKSSKRCKNIKSRRYTIKVPIAIITAMIILSKNGDHFLAMGIFGKII